MKNYWMSILLLLGSLHTIAQTFEGDTVWEYEPGPSAMFNQSYTMEFPQSEVRDSPYDEETRNTFVRAKNCHVRQADVMWSKRIWRKIDLREKMNQSLYFPTKPLANRQALFDVLVYNIFHEGTITPYDPGPLGDTDDFSLPMTLGDLQDKLVEYDTVMVEDLDGNIVPTPVETRVSAKDITHYVVKEDWFFDSKRSVMDVRILGIAPVRAVMADDGTFKGYELLFWVYYPEAQFALSRSPSFNRQNTAANRSFEEVFRKRMFSSVIIKESNVYDRYIAEYKTGINALLEAEGIHEDMFNFEQDMWEW